MGRTTQISTIDYSHWAKMCQDQTVKQPFFRWHLKVKQIFWFKSWIVRELYLSQGPVITPIEYHLGTQFRIGVVHRYLNF